MILKVADSESGNSITSAPSSRVIFPGVYIYFHCIYFQAQQALNTINSAARDSDSSAPRLTENKIKVRNSGSIWKRCLFEEEEHDPDLIKGTYPLHYDQPVDLGEAKPFNCPSDLSKLDGWSNFVSLFLHCIKVRLTKREKWCNNDFIQLFYHIGIDLKLKCSVSFFLSMTHYYYYTFQDLHAAMADWPMKRIRPSMKKG